MAYSTGYATLATLSSAVEGYPSNALVGYSLDAKGLPVFCFSAMSSHTKDLMAAERTCTEGGKAALCVTAKVWRTGRQPPAHGVAASSTQPGVASSSTRPRAVASST